ncbi:hypothetical protein ACOKFD_16865 [Flagellimonas sp. S174]|uniref:hypothetical protein n=1 Tax=Flagellimonas sp. S174 TaxID=3410790 RepID=UPI003BF4F825
MELRNKITGITFFLFIICYYSRAQDWPYTSGYVYFGASTLDQSQVGNYALLQHKTNGTTFLNSPQELHLRIGNHNKLNISGSGNIGTGSETNPKSQFVVASNFGANISGSTGGNSIFGSNLAVIQGGTNHNKLFTPSNHSNNYGFSGMRASWGKLYFYTKYGNTSQGAIVTDAPKMYIGHTGKVGIGTTSPDSKLTVKGNIHAEEVKVDLSVPGPDYVFKEGYDLKSLEEVQNYIKEKGHLPNIPSAKEMEENGIQLGEMNMKLLEKIEELTLYILDLKEENEKIKKELRSKGDLENRIQQIERELKFR